MSQQEIASRLKQTAEPADDLFLTQCGHIYQKVSAENDVKQSFNRIALVHQVDGTKMDDLLQNVINKYIFLESE
jgi:hypothetical protein